MLDDSWFLLNRDYELIWLQADTEVSKRQNRTFQSEKVLLTIIGNPAGFQLTDFLSRWAKFNASHCAIKRISPRAIWREIQVGNTDRRLVLHFETTWSPRARRTREFLEENRMKRGPQLAYSRGLASDDVCLCACIKGLFAVREFASWSELLQAVMDILNGIENAT
jgi:hypothetical protein